MLFESRKRNRRKQPAPQEDEAGPRWSLSWFTPLLTQGLKPVLGMSGAIVGALLLVWGVVTALDRPIAQVQVGGQFQRVASVQIEAAVAPFRGAGFLSIDMDALRAALEKIPWVDRVRVERRWPKSVWVLITEHVPAARWGEDGLMNTRGELFLQHVQHLPPELPQLVGPEGTQEAVAKLYLDSYPRLLAVGMRLTKVELDARGAWALTLNNGVQVRLGRQNVQERLERFLRIASPMVAARGTAVSYVDLRYSNGFSVGWNPVTQVAHDLKDLTSDG